MIGRIACGLLAAAGMASVTLAQGAPITPNQAQLQVVGARAFAQCAACHALEAGKPSGVGPNLHRLFGKRAGTNAADYAYSPAMKSYGAVWTDKTLDAFLSAPTKTVVGTKMAYRGIADANMRAALIAFIKAR